MEVTKQDCGGRQFFFQCLVKLQLSLDNHNPRRLVHVNVEASLNPCEVSGLFLLVESKGYQLGLACVGHHEDHDEGPFKPVHSEPLVDECYVRVLQVKFLHFETRVKQEFEVAILCVVIKLQAVIPALLKQLDQVGIVVVVP